MNINLYTELPIGLSFVCIVIAFLLAWYLYRNDNSFKDISKWKVNTMFAFRFIFIFLISFLLLSPLLRSVQKRIDKPVIIFAQDNSESISQIKDSLFYKNEYPDLINDFMVRLNDLFEVREFSFDNGINESFNVDFSGKGSNYSSTLEDIGNRFINRNVGALIVAGDGLYNKGSSPLIASSAMRFPIYTIGLGDTAIYQDLRITEVNHNKFAFLGNNFPIRVNTEAKEALGEELVLTVSWKGQIVESWNTSISNQAYSGYVDFNIEAKETGLQHYTLNIKSLQNEINVVNNKYEILIDIIDSKQKILVLYNSPHPDISALNNSLSSNINFDPDYITVSDFSGDISKYNLIILHQLPSLSNACTNIISDILKFEIPTLFIVGTQSSIERLNSLNAGLEIQQSNNSFADVLGTFNQGFSLFNIDDISANYFKKYPPLISPFGNFVLAGGSIVLAHQNLKGIATNKPLIMFYNDGDHKTGIIAGEGIWRWRVNDFLEDGSYDKFDDLINKIVQYLSLRLKKERFVIENKNVFLETDPIIFNADVYNKSYELNNENEVNLTVISVDNKEYNFIFNRFSNSYRYEAGYFPVGDYSWHAGVNFENESFTANGKFTVMPVNKESLNTKADHQLLYRMSENNNGKLYFPNQLEELFQQLKSDESIIPVIRKKEKLMDLINLKLLFFIILGFMSFEWFMRKFYGGY